MEHNQPKYIVHHSSIGLGDILITLCAAHDYAVRYKVPLIVDWRNSRWLSHEREKAEDYKELPNLFEILFDNRGILAGVPIITDSSKIHNIIPNEELSDLVFRPQPLTGEIKMSYDNGLEKILPRNYSTRVDKKKRMIIKSLQFSSRYASKADKFLEQLNKKDFVALHVRIGNGEYHEINIGDMPKLIVKIGDEVHRIIESIEKISNKKNALYITSDTPDVIEYFENKYDKRCVITFSGMRPPKSTTASHLYVDSNTPKDKAMAMLETDVVEMLIMSKARYLISVHSRPHISGFIYYARNFVPAINCYFIIGLRFRNYLISYIDRMIREKLILIGICVSKMINAVRKLLIDFTRVQISY